MDVDACRGGFPDVGSIPTASTILMKSNRPASPGSVPGPPGRIRFGSPASRPYLPSCPARLLAPRRRRPDSMVPHSKGAMFFPSHVGNLPRAPRPSCLLALLVTRPLLDLTHPNLVASSTEITSDAAPCWVSWRIWSFTAPSLSIASSTRRTGGRCSGSGVRPSSWRLTTARPRAQGSGPPCGGNREEFARVRQRSCMR